MIEGVRARKTPDGGLEVEVCEVGRRDREAVVASALEILKNHFTSIAAWELVDLTPSRFGVRSVWREVRFTQEAAKPKRDVWLEGD